MWGKFLFVGVLLFNCHSQAMVYGADNRKPLTMEYAEKIGLRPIVYLLIKKPIGVVTCTGAWISETLILTARHCVANSKNILVINQYNGYLGESRALGKRFFVDGSSSDTQQDWYNAYGPNAGSRPNQKDWAVIEIRKEAGGEPKTIINAAGMIVKNLQQYGDGATNGTLPIGDSRILSEYPGIELAAYHTDANDTLYREFCRYRPRDLKAQYWLMSRINLIEFDCDMMEGASGAPLLKCDGYQCKIVGVVSGDYPTEDPLPEFNSRNGNTAVPSVNFMDSVNRIIKNDRSNAKSFNLGQPKCKLTTCL
jgi:V8-like Glu-specific endopeptidase